MLQDKSERVVYVDREDGGGVAGLGWFLAGAAVGAMLGVLFAPRSGRETRELIGDRLEDFRDRAEERLEDLGDDIASGVAKAKAQVGEKLTAVGEEVSEKVSKVRRRVGDFIAPDEDLGAARNDLERRLAQARARRQADRDAAEEEPVA